LLHQEIGGADIDREEIVEIGEARVLDRRGFRNAGIGDENVELVADDVAHHLSDLMRRLRCGEIG
jgi:hypothetical protein